MLRAKEQPETNRRVCLIHAAGTQFCSHGIKQEVQMSSITASTKFVAATVLSQTRAPSPRAHRYAAKPAWAIMKYLESSSTILYRDY